MEEDNIEIRSEEVQEVLGKPPRWIIRWGISTVFIVIAGLIIGSHFFKYPEVINSSIVITTENPPVNIKSYVNGRIQYLFVDDTQTVTTDQILSVIQNPANYIHVLKTDTLLQNDRFKIQSYDTTVLDELNSNFQLGHIQNSYSLFIKSFSDYKNFLELNYYPQKIISVQQQLKMSELYIDRLTNQKNILKNELQIELKNYERSKELHKNGVIPDAEIEKIESSYLSKKYAFEGAHSTLANTQIEIENLKQSIIELQIKANDELKKLQLSISETYSNLLASIAEWKQNYLIVSPIDGKVTFNKFWSKNQNVIAGENVLAVVPLNSGPIIGKLNLSIEKSGKVQIGQRVNIKFLSYPHLEYGMVSGMVKSISLAPNNNIYLVEVNLNDGLLTNYGNRLDFTQEMAGNAEIITQDMSILQRILNPVYSVYKKNFDNQ